MTHDVWFLAHRWRGTSPPTPSTISARVRNAALLALLLIPVACEDPRDPLHFAEERALGREDELASGAAAAVSFPDQITVYDEDQLDAFDRSELHVPVPTGQEAVVQARASALLAVADSATLPQPSIVALTSAQRFAAEIAHSDVVATADVVAVRPIVMDDGTPTELYEVTFAVDTLLRGSTAVTWTSRLPRTSSCGPVAPEVGDEVLAFLHVGTGRAQLRVGAPLVPVVRDAVTLHGVRVSVADLMAVFEQNPETT